MIPKPLDFVLNLPSTWRRLILVIIDIFIIIFSLYTCFWCSNSFFGNSNYLSSTTIIKTIAIAILSYTLSGQYKGLTRYISSISLYKLSLRNLLILFLLIIFNNPSYNFYTNLKFWILFTFIFNFYITLLRVLLRDILRNYELIPNKAQKNIIIYGAGSAGTELYSNIRNSNKYKVLYFIDDNMNLWKRTIDGIKIRPPKFLHNSKNIDFILLAIPSLTFRERKDLISKLKKYSISLLQVPTLNDITTGRASIDELKPICIEDLLGRAPIPQAPIFIESSIKNKTICITGAGGSIGSELCLQILKYGPKKILLIENHEPSLYKIHQKLLFSFKKLSKSPIEDIIEPLLINATDFILLNSTFKKHKVDIIFHAAAFKHVPLVEKNQISGIYNNIFSTKNICEASINNSIKTVVLISSDKAVRPTSIMGATKRLSELICKAYNQNSIKTKFTMVRFGNVLGSSGSVVPLFKKQISQGGPITVTDPQIIRYFMTVKEAVELVIQVIPITKGGDVFLLDMGEPVKIFELAKSMIIQSGLSIKDKNNINGDIEIQFTGLRPGEKLFEELLVGKDSEKTQHPLIFKDSEKVNISEEFFNDIDNLESLIKKGNHSQSLNQLSLLVPEWNKKI